MERWQNPATAWIYMDHHILWRSRLQRRGKPVTTLFERHKLFVLERREQNRLVALVTDQAMAPQHGGRFFYFAAGPGRSVDDLHTMCALLNSRLVSCYYRAAGQGNKDLRVRPLASMPGELRARLCAASKRQHELHLQAAPGHALDSAAVQAEIDSLVEDLYELSPAERQTLAQL